MSIDNTEDNYIIIEFCFWDFSIEDEFDNIKTAKALLIENMNIFISDLNSKFKGQFDIDNILYAYPDETIKFYESFDKYLDVYIKGVVPNFFLDLPIFFMKLKADIQK